MNKTNVACEILKIEAHLSLTRAAMLQNNQKEYLIHLQSAGNIMTKLVENTVTGDLTKALITD